MQSNRLGNEICLETENSATTNADTIISSLRDSVMLAAVEGRDDNATKAIYDAALSEELDQRLTEPAEPDDHSIRDEIEGNAYVAGADEMLTAIAGGMRSKADVLADTDAERRTLLDTAAEIETRIRGDSE
ncbi:hypothetical protein NDI85_06135 [Halomicroarcula sp. S1AR25-4]|uniref:hypothetical protein n=1 Tax=Haloarcula sp. S1AR25-4 TaxID=2950538 RepID=UPI002876401A|nr:hypothetical protein [Halomicroarcula sp. S1AR25-4]MDS0277365.1 hypothetical protein [Halomicroarcula sp. S1AR25-4]